MESHKMSNLIYSYIIHAVGESHEAFQLQGFCCRGACNVYIMVECVTVQIQDAHLSQVTHGTGDA